jgi:hypothetical protein
MLKGALVSAGLAKSADSAFATAALALVKEKVVGRVWGVVGVRVLVHVRAVWGSCGGCRGACTGEVHVGHIAQINNA